MVQSTIGLAHSLGRKVVAEGVEHRDILDLLVEMGCDIAQGFAIGRPMSLESLTKRLAVRPQAQRRLTSSLDKAYLSQVFALLRSRRNHGYSFANHID